MDVLSLLVERTWTYSLLSSGRSWTYSLSLKAYLDVLSCGEISESCLGIHVSRLKAGQIAVFLGRCAPRAR